MFAGSQENTILRNVSAFPEFLTKRPAPDKAVFFPYVQWEPLIWLQAAQPSMEPTYRYEMNYFNSCGYWLGLQKSFFAIFDQVAREEETTEPQGTMARLLVWAGILGEYAIRVLAVLYRNSVKDPMNARINKEMHE